MNLSSNLKRKLLFELVQRIPSRKVVSYKSLGLLLNTSPRAIGNWLHQNNNSQLPCFKVVRNDGSLAAGYRFGGIKGQRARLLADGVKFISSWRVAGDQFFNFKIIFFDIDGTLLDDKKFKFKLWQFLAQCFGSEEGKISVLYRQFKSSDLAPKGLTPGFGKFLTRVLGVKINLKNHLGDFFSLAKAEFRDPDLRRRLKKLSRSHLLGIFSRGDVFTQLGKLELLGIKDLFFPSLIFIDPKSKQKQASQIRRLAESGLFKIWVVDDEDYCSLFQGAQVNFLLIRSRSELLSLARVRPGVLDLGKQSGS